LDILSDVSKSSTIGVNDIDSDFNKAVIGLSDGRYIVYTSDFSVYSDSKLQVVHKILIVGNDIWMFGNSYFKISSESFVRKLATGTAIY
jgi:hypothetical protein